MLILLPPSEGKWTPDSGPSLALSKLSYPALRAPRRTVLTTLTHVCSEDPQGAAAALGLGPRQHDWITQNSRLRKAPTAPASAIYTGVLFEALDLQSLTAAQRKRAASRLAISSALFGLVSIDDHIPAYRLSGDTRLPQLSLKDVWRTPLTSILTSTSGLIVDMRSGAYSALAPLPPQLDRAASVKVIRPDGSTISHHNKATKGHLARSLALMGREPRSLAELRDAISTEGFRARLSKARGAWELIVEID